jgi:hypothetical protein
MLAIAFGVPFLLNLVVVLIVACAVIALIAWIMRQAGFPAPVGWIVWGIVIVVVLIAALRLFGVST